MPGSSRFPGRIILKANLMATFKSSAIQKKVKNINKANRVVTDI